MIIMAVRYEKCLEMLGKEERWTEIQICDSGLDKLFYRMRGEPYLLP